MKISKETFAILRNFSAINQSLLMMPGNVIKTAVAGNTKDFYAIATVSEEFPVKCAIYDLKKFRECAGLFGDPEFDFSENFVKITDGKSMFNYVYCNSDIIDAPNYEKKIELKNPIASFEVRYAQIKQTIDASNILGLETVMISGVGGVITLSAFDENNKSSDTFKVVVAEGIEGPDFTSKYNIDKLRKLIDADYIVTINEKVLTELKSSLVTYYHGGDVTVTI